MATLLLRPRGGTTTRRRRACAARRGDLQAATAGLVRLLGTIDKRIAEAVAAQYAFTKDQQELLFDILKDARDAMRGEISKAIEERDAPSTRGLRRWSVASRAPGVLPPVKAWRQGMVVYEGELASFEGQLYQAKMDTGLQPGDEGAFICVARAGKDAVQVTPRGDGSASTDYEHAEPGEFIKAAPISRRATIQASPATATGAGK